MLDGWMAIIITNHIILSFLPFNNIYSPRKINIEGNPLPLYPPYRPNIGNLFNLFHQSWQFFRLAHNIIFLYCGSHLQCKIPPRQEFDKNPMTCFFRAVPDHGYQPMSKFSSQTQLLFYRFFFGVNSKQDLNIPPFSTYTGLIHSKTTLPNMPLIVLWYSAISISLIFFYP